jgi:hypothetical protein
MSKGDDIVVITMTTTSVRDSVGHACTKKSVARKALGTVAVIAVCVAR